MYSSNPMSYQQARHGNGSICAIVALMSVGPDKVMAENLYATKTGANHGLG